MSRPRSSARASSTPARGTARPAGRPGVYVATPKSDVYVTLLGVALGAMILASGLLALLLSKYDFKITP